MVLLLFWGGILFFVCLMMWEHSQGELFFMLHLSSSISKQQIGTFRHANTYSHKHTHTHTHTHIYTDQKKDNYISSVPFPVQILLSILLSLFLRLAFVCIHGVQTELEVILGAWLSVCDILRLE